MNNIEKALIGADLSKYTPEEIEILEVFLETYFEDVDIEILQLELANLFIDNRFVETTSKSAFVYTQKELVLYFDECAHEYGRTRLEEFSRCKEFSDIHNFITYYQEEFEKYYEEGNLEIYLNGYEYEVFGFYIFTQDEIII